VNALIDPKNDMFAERLPLPDQRELVVSTVMEGFAQLQKKSVPDLPIRMKKMEERVRNMAQQVALHFVNGRLVVKVVGSAEALMTELRRGSDWYEPWERVDDHVVAAILLEPTK
jgi:hypothetical protein